MAILAGWILVGVAVFLLYLILSPIYDKVGKEIMNFTEKLKNKNKE